MDILGAFMVPVAIVAVVLSLIGVLMFVSRNYMRCPPNQVLVLYGRKHQWTDENNNVVTRGYRLITGGAAFRLPLLEESQELSLAMFQVPVRVEKSPNKDGVRVTVDAVANVKISSDQGPLGSAVEQFLGKTQQEIEVIIHSTLEGIVRQLIGTLSIEEMVREREQIAHKVIELTGSELAKLGVECKNFVIARVEDSEGYIEALGRKRAAEVLRDAQIGEAEAQREATIKSSTAKREAEQKRLENDQQVAEAEKELAVKRATYDALVKAEQAKAALAGQIASAERAKDLKKKEVEVEQAAAEAQTFVVQKQAELAEKQAALAEKQLVASKIKPAEAARDAMKIEAEGEKQAAILRAEAAREAAKLAAEGKALAAAQDAEAAKSRAEAATSEAEATKALAGAQKVKLQSEGEGHAEAEAALVQKRGEAEGAAIRAKLLAEAEGIQKKNEALERMSEGAKLILVLDRMPDLIDRGGEALAKALGPAFQSVGAGLAAVDKIEIIDFGGNGNGSGTALQRFMLAIPELALKVATEAGKTGVDVRPMLAKLGIQMLGNAATGTNDGSPNPPAST